MNIESIQPGDILFASNNIINDGSLPGFSENELIAEAGQRGVLINTGYLEDNPDKVLLLIRFESSEESGKFGPAVACWPEEVYSVDDIASAN